MTVSTDDRRRTYYGNGVVVEFAGPKLYDADHLTVYAIDDASGVATELVAGSDYEVTGIGVAESTVTLTDAPATGVTLVLLRTVPLTQESRFTGQGAFFPEIHEEAFDLAVMRAQQIQDQLDRTLRLSELSDLETELDDPVPGSVPMVNSDGTGFTWGLHGTNPDALASLALSTGAALLGDQASETGAVAATQAARNRWGWVLDTEFGAVGNGVADDTTALANGMAAAMLRGGVFAMRSGKTYAVSSFAPPAGITIFTFGARIIASVTTVSNSALVSVAGDDVCVIGELEMHIPTGLRRDRVLSVSGAYCQFDDITATSDDQQANTGDADDAAVRFSGALGVRFGVLRVDKFDQAVQFKGSSGAQGRKFALSSYTRAVHVEDSPHLRMETGGRIHTTSPNASYTPGHVGVLVSSTVDDGTTDLVIPNLTVEDAAEHGVRVGGPARNSEIHFPGLLTRNTGGCGMKVLGTDSGTPTSRNRNVTCHGAIFEDAGTGGLTSNMCGLLAMHCDGVHADNIIVRKNGKLQSGYAAVRVAACSDVRITGDYADAAFDAVWLDGSLGDLDRIHVGGTARGCGRDGYRLTAGTATVRRVTTDLNCDGNAGLGMNIAVGAGTMTESLFRAKLYANAGGSVACDSTAAVLDIVGQVGAITPLSGITAADGSAWRDTGGLVYHRVGADWLGRGRVRLGAAVVNNNAVANTIQDVTGLAFPVKTGRTYRFRFFIPYAVAATTTGSRWSINGPVAIYLNYRSEYSAGASSRTVNEGLGGAYDAPAASNTDSASLSRNIAVIEGIINPNADGTLQARFASEVAGSAVTASAHAYVEYEEVLE